MLLFIKNIIVQSSGEVQDSLRGGCLISMVELAIKPKLYFWATAVSDFKA